MKLFNAIAAAAVIGASLVIAPPTEANTSHDWARYYLEKRFDWVKRGCSQGRRINAAGYSSNSAWKKEGVITDMQRDGYSVMNAIASFDGMVMAKKAVCPSVW